MKISVITPFFNNEKWIRFAIESIISQTYTNWELILVNDGSTDKSGNIAKSYAERDNRIKVIEVEKNSGVNRARNIGLVNVSSDSSLTTFLDGDDTFIDSALLTMSETTQIYPNISRFLFSVKKENGDVVSSAEKGDGIYNQRQAFRYISGEWVNVFRSEFIRDGSFRYDERVVNGFESIAYFNYAKSHDAFYSSKVVRIYRVHPDSMTNSRSYSQQKLLDMSVGYSLTIENLESLGLGRRRSSYLSKLCAVLAFVFLMRKDKANFSIYLRKAFRYNLLEVRVYRNLLLYIKLKIQNEI